MLSADDQPGIFMFAVGMIVLVMVAVGLSVVFDLRGQWNIGKRLNEETISNDAGDISELMARRDGESADLKEFVQRSMQSSQELREISAKLANFQERRDFLVKSKVALEQAVQLLETQFSDCRARYRSETWKAAVGEKLGDVKVRDGRLYRDSVISQVTLVGLEIRHESGFARLQAPDLSAELQDRFQWNGEERRARLAEEAAARQEIPNAPQLAPTIAVPVRPQLAGRPDPDAFRNARQQVSAWKLKVSELQSECRTATSNARGGSPSVPGSLETWSAKAERLGRDLERARMALSLAKSNLEAISPRDSLLRDPMTGE
jgi:hypothetical protein